MSSRLCYHPNVFYSGPAYGGNHPHDKSVIQGLVSFQVNASFLILIKIYFRLSREEQKVYYFILLPENFLITFNRYGGDVLNRNRLGGLFGKLYFQAVLHQGSGDHKNHQ